MKPRSTFNRRSKVWGRGGLLVVSLLMISPVVAGTSQSSGEGSTNDPSQGQELPVTTDGGLVLENGGKKIIRRPGGSQGDENQLRRGGRARAKENAASKANKGSESRIIGTKSFSVVRDSE